MGTTVTVEAEPTATVQPVAPASEQVALAAGIAIQAATAAAETADTATATAEAAESTADLALRRANEAEEMARAATARAEAAEAALAASLVQDDADGPERTVPVIPDVAAAAAEPPKEKPTLFQRILFG